MEYISIISKSKVYATVLLKNGNIKRVRLDKLEHWKKVPLYRNYYISDILDIEPQINEYIHPKNVMDRVYLYKKRKSKDSSIVYLEDNTAVVVPNDKLEAWYRYGELDALDIQANYIGYCRRKTMGVVLGELTFGVELEFTARSSNKCEFEKEMIKLLGEERYGVDDDTIQWRLKTDGSIQAPVGRDSYELTSPVLRLKDKYYEELRKVLDCIRQVFGGKVNASCGTHIHIGGFLDIPIQCVACNGNGAGIVKDYSDEIYKKMKAFSDCYLQFEQSVFDKLVYYDRRKSRNEYCESCEKATSEDRYFKINRSCLSVNGTIENRQHQGTLNIDEIWSWMTMNGMFLVKFLKDSEVFSEVQGKEEFFFSDWTFGKISEILFKAGPGYKCKHCFGFGEANEEAQ